MSHLARKYPVLLILVLVLFAGLSASKSAAASSLVKGTFVEVGYEEIQIDDDVVEKRLKTVTIENKDGRTITLNIDKYATLSINTLPTTIDAFKSGMEVEVDVNLRRVKELRGTSGTSQGNIDYRNKVVVGTVNGIDKSGKFLSIRLDDGGTEKYYLNEETNIYKETKLVDLSMVYEGDRVKLTFSEYKTNYISEMEVNVQGIKVEALYKGKIQRIEPIGNTITITDVAMFRNWMWEQNTSKNISYTYSTQTPIYVGDQEINVNRLRYYKDHDVYFVTVSQFGKQVIKKLVIKQTNERTFYERMTSVDLPNNSISLKATGKIKYHNGTILIRNGRLVDENSLQYSGTAFVVTDGIQKSQYANIIHITNDGFQSPNLTNHSIYFGRIHKTGSYQLTLNNAKLLSNNYWISINNPTFSFSNDTIAVRDFNHSTLSILPRDEMVDKIGEYGYFYVADNHIVAVHLIKKNTSIAKLVSVGRLAGFQNYPNIIHIRNVSQWQGGVWADVGEFSSMNIANATIIRGGKVISAKDLQTNDRLYILHDSSVNGRLIFVD